MLGSVLAVPFAPYINQKLGRRWAIMIGSLVMIIGAIIQAFSQHIGMYIVARMILGMGILFCIIAGASLIGELSHPKERAFLTSLFNASYGIGQITAASIAIATPRIAGDWAWRLPSLLQICPSLLQIATVFLLPESPRYLISKDRDDEAMSILIKYHAEGDASSLLIQAEITQIRETIHLEMEAAKQSWFDLIRTAGMRRRVYVTIFVGLFTQLSGNTLISYYSNQLFELMGYTTPFAKTRINVAGACWGFATAVIIALVVPRFPRRWMYMLSATLMLLCFTGYTVALERQNHYKDLGVKSPRAVNIAGLFFYFGFSPCYAIGNNALTYSKRSPPPCGRNQDHLSNQADSCFSSQHTLSSFGPMLHVAAVSASSRSLESSQVSSLITLTLLLSPPSAGATWLSTVVGLPLSSLSYSFSILKPSTALLRSLLSCSRTRSSTTGPSRLSRRRSSSVIRRSLTAPMLTISLRVMHRLGRLSKHCPEDLHEDSLSDLLDGTISSIVGRFCTRLREAVLFCSFS